MTSDRTVVPLRQPDAVDDPLTMIFREGASELCDSASAQAHPHTALISACRNSWTRRTCPNDAVGLHRCHVFEVARSGGSARFTNIVRTRWSRIFIERCVASPCTCFASSSRKSAR